MMVDGWADADILVCRDDGTKAIRRGFVKGAEPLGVTPFVVYENGEEKATGEWVITHLRTGMSLPHHPATDAYPGPMSAQLMAEVFLSLADWEFGIFGKRGNSKKREAARVALRQYHGLVTEARP